MIDKTYYKKMLGRGRLIPVIEGNELIGFLSFYITNDINKYLRDDPWTVLDDEPETGKICYVDQIWGKTGYHYHKYSFKIWKKLKQFLKSRYPQVKYIRWNRWKNEKVNIYKKEVGRCQQ